MLRLTSAALAALAIMAVSAAGAAPPPGPSHTSYFAVVDTDGNLVRGSTGTGAFKGGIGIVVATFPVDVTNCTYVATLGRAIRHGGKDERPGFISVVRANGFTNGVFVETRSPNSKLHDRPFHLFVAC